MLTLLNFAVLALSTVLAVAAAVGLYALLLRAAFALMRPATSRRTSGRTELVRGTTQLARVFATHR
jgi:hypothetical protein